MSKLLKKQHQHQKLCNPNFKNELGLLSLNYAIMKTDSEIKNDILDELAWQPNIDETQIEVIVKDGIVRLTGVVDSYAKKLLAEKAATSVCGVTAVTEDIEVEYSTGKGSKSDKDIATAAVYMLKWNSSVPHRHINIKVEDGWVYLTGEAQWAYQKNAAKNVIANLHGVKGVVNNIRLKRTIEPSEIKKRISKAFERYTNLEAKNITINVDGNTVTLTGTVHSLTEKDDAINAAFFVPNVTQVINKLKVSYYREYA